MSSFTVPFVIDGEDVYTDDTFQVISAASGKPLHRCALATTQTAARAVAASAAAAGKWAATPPSRRREILIKAADIMTSRQDELAGHMMEEIGATREWAGFNLGVSTQMLREVAGQVGAGALNGTVPALADPQYSGMVWMEPYGVVLAIAPWNAPYILGLRALLFPIAAGCTAVFKGSENAPRTHYSLVKVFCDAGLPKGVLNFIATTPALAYEVTESVISNPLVKKLNFTGSTAVGRIVGRLAGEHLKPAVMELGGKGAAIVWDDAPLDIAAEQCTVGAFLNAGQICMSTERIIVHRKISKAFQARFLESIEAKYPPGQEGLVLINEQAAEKNRRLLRDAVEKGAAILTNGTDLEGQAATKGRMRPVVLHGVTPIMDIYKTESFGPSVSIIEVDTEAEALSIANDTEYGLNFAVFTNDLNTGLRFAKGIEAGAVHINSMTIHDEDSLPHGGAKSSGYGRFNGSTGLKEWVRTKAVTWKNQSQPLLT